MPGFARRRASRADGFARFRKQFLLNVTAGGVTTYLPNVNQRR